MTSARRYGVYLEPWVEETIARLPIDSVAKLELGNQGLVRGNQGLIRGK